MNRATVVIVGIVVALAAFLAGYASAPRMANAPSSSPPSALPADAASLPMAIVSITESASTSPAVTVEYPQFPTLSTDFNSSIASSTLSRLADFRQAAAETMAARQATGDPSAVIPPSDYSFIASWQPAQSNSRYVSFIERYDSYTGGANENQDIQTFNYDLRSGREIALADLFPDAPDYLNEISSIARQELLSSLNEASNGNVSMSMLDDGTAPTADNFADFTFYGYAVTFYFPKYAVAPGSFGEQKAVVSFDSVR